MHLLLAVCLIGAMLTILNSLTMRVVRPRIKEEIKESISVLIPMRNEEANVDAVVTCIHNSLGLLDWDLLILDDSSTDSTARKLESLQLNTLSGKTLPDGWLGKNWACWQLAQASKGEYLVFVDADVRLHPTAIASSINKMNELKWDFISPYPRQIAQSFLEHLFQPLLQWSWMASVPLRLAEVLRVNSMTIANGQFFIVRRDAYFDIGGHEGIRAEVLDDLRLARTLVSGGYRGGVAEASSVAQCRMYENATDLINGYTKSLWTAFGGSLGTLLAVLLLVGTQISPILLGLSGSALGWLAYAITALSHGTAAARTKSSPANMFLHPLSALLLIVLIIESIRRKSAGKLIWRERYLA
jgi:hypothetical protein